MVSGAIDYANEIEMVQDNYNQLREKDTNHELLKLADPVGKGRGLKFKPEFWQKCCRAGHKAIYALMEYNTFLQSALRGRSYKFVNDPIRMGVDNLEDSFKQTNNILMSSRSNQQPTDLGLLKDILEKTTFALNTDLDLFDVKSIYFNALETRRFSCDYHIYGSFSDRKVSKNRKLLIDTVQQIWGILESNEDKEEVKEDVDEILKQFKKRS